MTYGNFQRLDEARAYSRMRREQREDDIRQDEFDKEVEKEKDNVIIELEDKYPDEKYPDWAGKD